ncbi:MAG: hypothetical protein KatS3mg044_1194 [Rhodothermaceae bacterium]|nr:MAG: hypothetical protein KatS3mg044_1194 [Rhodothermaceae bacterium]
MVPSAVVPSSASVTCTLNGMVAPQLKMPPATGASMVTSGRVLPAVMVTVAEPLRPVASVTVRRAVKVPASVYVCAASGVVASVVPSPVKSHA